MEKSPTPIADSFPKKPSLAALAERRRNTRSFSTNLDQHDIEKIRNFGIQNAPREALLPRPTLKSVRDKLHHRRLSPGAARDLDSLSPLPSSYSEPATEDTPPSQSPYTDDMYNSESVLYGFIREKLAKFLFSYKLTENLKNIIQQSTSSPKPKVFSEQDIYVKLKDFLKKEEIQIKSETALISNEATLINNETSQIVQFDYISAYKDREKQMELVGNILLKELDSYVKECYEVKTNLSTKIDILNLENENFSSKIKELEDFFVEFENKEAEINELENKLLNSNYQSESENSIKVIRQRYRCLKKTFIERIKFAQKKSDSKKLELLTYKVGNERLEIENENLSIFISQKKAEKVKFNNEILNELNDRLISELEVKHHENKVLTQNIINFQREINELNNENSDLKKYDQRLSKTLAEQNSQHAYFKSTATELEKKGTENKNLEVNESDLKLQNQQLKSKLFDYITLAKKYNQKIADNKNLKTSQTKSSDYKTSHENFTKLSDKLSNLETTISNILTELQYKKKLGQVLEIISEKLMESDFNEEHEFV